MKRQPSLFGIMVVTGILTMIVIPVLAAHRGIIRQPQPAPEVLPVPIPEPLQPPIRQPVARDNQTPKPAFTPPESPPTPPGVPVPYPNTGAPRPAPAMK